MTTRRLSVDVPRTGEREIMGLRFTYVPPGRFWTPAWDNEFDQPCVIEAAKTADGRWHSFGRYVSAAWARHWQAQNGGIVIA